jgi:hypothetical protein
VLTTIAVLMLATAQPKPSPSKASMDEVLGNPIGLAVSRFGQPARIFDLDGGLRVFQWPGPKTPPATLAPVDVYTTPGALSPPRGAVASDNAERVSGQGCYETLYAQWALDDWFLMEHAPPPAGCK